MVNKYAIKVITTNNIDSISINIIDFVKFCLNLFNISKKEEEIEEISISFLKGKNLFDSNSFNNIKSPQQIYTNNNVNEIIAYNTHLKNVISTFFKDLLKTDKQIDKINAYYEMNNNANVIDEIEKCAETYMDENFYAVKIIIQQKLFISKIFFANNLSIIVNDLIDMKQTTKKITQHTNNILWQPNAYKIWTKEEENDMLIELKNNIFIEKIAEIHGRSVGGIEARLKKIIKNKLFENKNIKQISDELYITEEKIKYILEKKYY